MRTETPPLIHLSDYRPSDFLIDRVDLDVRLHPSRTRVTAVLALRPNPAGDPDAPLRLDGDELSLVALDLDGRPLPEDAYAVGPSGLVLAAPPRRPFTLSIVTELDPGANTKLMGLYRSSGVYCTQCEADGFRRITYFLDRPDVLSVYTTRIEADRDEAPVLLGNGNPVEAGALDGGRHYAVWHDPHPKPAYLFALVGGRLGNVATRFTTMEGRAVAVAVHVEPGKEARADYALDAVVRSMKWDEEAFGRPYDLDVFNVVAVSDFNMGAMENKGLNIFNDKYVLASPETATDADYAAIEAIIAHEYFHNWSGNRVTCRDWFQLCLKEGLTVFRDQEFSSDMRSRAVHRIAEVRQLRARQFPEDAGPLRHPVRPTAYAEINNFYTATVYEKGAEIVRMLKTLLGPDAFRAGMDRYFAENDGRAATVEDFLDAFAAVSGRDLAAFAQWYARPGTPRLAFRTAYDAAAGTCDLTLWQSLDGGSALVMPVALGLVGTGGALDADCPDLADGVYVLKDAEATLRFRGVTERPVPSLLRGFSAPVRLDGALTEEDHLVLLGRDTDPFNRWQAGQSLALRLIRGGGPADAFAEALGLLLDAEAPRDPAFAALMLSLPGEGEVANEIEAEVDPDAIHGARKGLRAALGRALRDRLEGIEARLAEPAGTPYSPDAAAAGRRALRNAALDLLAAGDPETGAARAAARLEAATNMTDRLAALGTLALIPGDAREAALAAFGARYADEPLVLDKWFALQATIPEPGTPERIEGLKRHPAYALTNPNRVRALVGSFAFGNPTQFARADGAGFALVADTVAALDGTNPQAAARLLTAFGSWRKLKKSRAAKAEEMLNRIKAIPGLSRDVADIVTRTIAPVNQL
ncbi:aminopeptidase N [Methylobacterium dankookense]|uniref:Aminopeptidase N n=1 Tax=Methylobacterium dankookense TaxID=560405 RepID=A0A564FVK9_9HYPH|nr:aminopeptidase N [Methylobacterium dankookense]GJD59692.1 Aminopeptidase N [Methylobacterium dankookense]VUF11451.1 Aminopeptidase N [Methylobacterium dankookense]